MNVKRTLAFPGVVIGSILLIGLTIAFLSPSAAVATEDVTAVDLPPDYTGSAYSTAEVPDVATLAESAVASVLPMIDDFEALDWGEWYWDADWGNTVMTTTVVTEPHLTVAGQVMNSIFSLEFISGGWGVRPGTTCLRHRTGVATTGSVFGCTGPTLASA